MDLALQVYQKRYIENSKNDWRKNKYPKHKYAARSLNVGLKREQQLNIPEIEMTIMILKINILRTNEK